MSDETLLPILISNALFFFYPNITEPLTPELALRMIKRVRSVTL